MHFFIFILLICLILFLFRLYHLGNDDYVLLKKNTTLEQVYNCAFVCSAVSLFFSRVFYVFLHPSPVFLNPLGFLLFPYFPGLSLTGGVLGGVACLLVYAKIKKLPRARVFDFFAASFLFVLPFGLVGYFLLAHDLSGGGILKLILYSLILVGVNLYLYPKANSLEMKDGTLATLFLIFFSLISLLANAIDHPGIDYFLSHRENYILLIMLIVSIVLVVKQEITGRIWVRGG